MSKPNITVPIQVNLPDDWIEQIVNRLRNDPESEWVEIIRCKDCKHMQRDEIFHQCWCNGNEVKPDHFCGYAERRQDGQTN